MPDRTLNVPVEPHALLQHYCADLSGLDNGHVDIDLPGASILQLSILSDPAQGAPLHFLLALDRPATSADHDLSLYLGSLSLKTPINTACPKGLHSLYWRGVDSLTLSTPFAAATLAIAVYR